MQIYILPISRTVYKFLQITGQICAFDIGYLSYDGQLTTTNFGFKKLQTSVYCMVFIYWQMIISFYHNPYVW